MALLDMQGMEPTRGDGDRGGSHFSLTLCASEASIWICL
jgi:hypothetical protein